MPFSLSPISPGLRDAVRFSLAIQIPLMLLAGSVADYGEAAQMCYFAFLAFNSFLFLVRLRRRAHPTRMDLFIIRAGFIPTIVATYLIAFWIWKLRES